PLPANGAGRSEPCRPGTAVTDGAPGFAVGLGLTNDCNLACAHCYRDTERVDHLSLANVRRVADRLPIRAVNLGTGENALHPEFSEILRELRARGIVTTLTSNGHSAAVLDDDELGWLHRSEERRVGKECRSRWPADR